MIEFAHVGLDKGDKIILIKLLIRDSSQALLQLIALDIGGPDHAKLVTGLENNLVIHRWRQILILI